MISLASKYMLTYEGLFCVEFSFSGLVLVIPYHDRQRYLSSTHDCANYFGTQNTLNFLVSLGFWFGMSADTSHYVQFFWVSQSHGCSSLTTPYSYLYFFLLYLLFPAILWGASWVLVFSCSFCYIFTLVNHCICFLFGNVVEDCQALTPNKCVHQIAKEYGFSACLLTYRATSFSSNAFLLFLQQP